MRLDRSSALGICIESSARLIGGLRLVSFGLVQQQDRGGRDGIDWGGWSKDVFILMVCVAFRPRAAVCHVYLEQQYNVSNNFRRSCRGVSWTGRTGLAVLGRENGLEAASLRGVNQVCEVSSARSPRYPFLVL